MKFSTSIVAAFLAATALATPTPVEVEKRAATTMCGSFGTVATGGYTVYHNNWGSGQATSGSQCTTFNSMSAAGSFSWSTTWTWAGGPTQVKSYSNVALEKINKALSTITSIPSTWTWNYSGYTNMVSDVSYDLWLAPSVGADNQYEIMVWLGAFGGAGPIASPQKTPIATPTIAGHKWKLYKGPNGDTTVFSFVVDGANIGGWSGDLNLFFKYLTSSQGIATSAVVTSLQAGTEPFIGETATFSTSAYTIKVNAS